jgi:hypothetical protein
MKIKKDFDKIFIALKYKKRFVHSLEFFRLLLLNPQKQIDDFLPLFEFISFYNSCFLYKRIPALEKILTVTELNSRNFQEFEVVYQKRCVLNKPLKKSEEKCALSVLSSDELSAVQGFLDGVFLFLNSSSFGELFREQSTKYDSTQQDLNESFFELADSKNFKILKQRARRFDANKNRFLKETIKLWFLREEILSCFLKVRQSPMTRFYLLFSLFSVDSKLSEFLGCLEAFVDLYSQIEELSIRLNAEQKASLKEIQSRLELEKSLLAIKSVKLTDFLPQPND